MSFLGKKTRLQRIFSHPSGKILSVAIDHLINYPIGMPEGLKDMDKCMASLIAGEPSAITMNKGIAKHYMKDYAGKVPLIIQQVAVKSDDQYFTDHASVEEVVALGADAIAVSICLKGATEAQQLGHLAKVVADAEPFGLPVIPHIYPLGSEGEENIVSHLSEDIFYAVRVGIEMGADVVKVPFTGDADSFRDIVSLSPIPIVAAGGPKCEDLNDTIKMVREISKSGASGATIGRNIWGFQNPTKAIQQLKEAMYST
ncbi:MAG: aldolase [Planctomycetota bacterium]|nr:MAG: aldolase [Planctomycetota bacterium]